MSGSKLAFKTFIKQSQTVSPYKGTNVQFNCLDHEDSMSSFNSDDSIIGKGSPGKRRKAKKKAKLCKTHRASVVKEINDGLLLHNLKGNE